MKTNPVRLPALACAPLVCALFLAAGLAMPVAAAEQRAPEQRAPEQRGPEAVLKAVDAGEILPLKTVLGRIEGEASGVVVDAELERRGGAWFYEIEIVQAGAVKLKLKVDARDGRIVERRTKPVR